MGIRVDIKRTDFYNELSEEKQKQFFSATSHKFLPAIDNIYYSVSIKNDYNGNIHLKPYFERLDEIKLTCTEERRPYPIGNGLLVDLLSYSIYKYCITNPDLYDIFLSNYLPNESTPRIVVQIRAYGLWVHGAEKMIADSYNSVVNLLSEVGLEVNSVKENRLDFCYHTNAILKPERAFSDRNMGTKLNTTMKKWRQEGRIQSGDNGLILQKDYIIFGNRTSNNVVARIYNKALEVIEMGYKGFFFEIWHKNGLISEYDKYCFEKALLNGNYNYIHKAKLEFYIEHGANEMVKREFRLTVADENLTYEDAEKLAASYMPEVTTVLNIEYETKRKFYYYSDEFIDSVLLMDMAKERGGVPVPLRRLYKIIDNRGVFLDYLTSVTLSFKRADGRYAAWWERLRKTRLDGLKVDIKLVRDYSSELDEEIARKRFVNTVVTNAVYAGNTQTGFVEDITDLLSSINDNEVLKLRINYI